MTREEQPTCANARLAPAAVAKREHRVARVVRSSVSRAAVDIERVWRRRDDDGRLPPHEGTHLPRVLCVHPRLEVGPEEGGGGCDCGGGGGVTRRHCHIGAGVGGGGGRVGGGVIGKRGEAAKEGRSLWAPPLGDTAGTPPGIRPHVPFAFAAAAAGRMCWCIGFAVAVAGRVRGRGEERERKIVTEVEPDPGKGGEKNKTRRDSEDRQNQEADVVERRGGCQSLPATERGRQDLSDLVKPKGPKSRICVKLEAAPPDPKSADKTVNHSTANEAEVKGNHTKLCHLIKTKKKVLNKKEILISNTTAAATLLDLEALSQYNDKLLDLALKKIKLKTDLRTASRLLRAKLKQRLANSRPAEEASLAISHRCGRGPYFARVLREMAAQLLSDGTLPEKHQGVGAHHESLLDKPAVCEALREWVKGTLEV
ncbi:hypothetical protein B0H14DRAFT_3130008 [Mycena olivaceomarginata]|nr:hypothetical protein B0H14DRAFT_3130008 [Mycena olivaceomarginata]